MPGDVSYKDDKDVWLLSVDNVDVEEGAAYRYFPRFDFDMVRQGGCVPLVGSFTYLKLKKSYMYIIGYLKVLVKCV